jgi:nitric oxide reductase NorE protein
MTAVDDAAPTEDVGRRRDPHLPGDFGIWFFVLGDLIIFGGYFLIFMVYRSQNRALFLGSQQHLSTNVGVVNTLLLIASSWFVALGVQRVRAGSHQQAMRLTLGGALCGLLFIAVKVYEWSSELGRGFTFPHNDFFMFYYTLTGIHLGHVALGLLILGIVVRDLRNPAGRRVSMAEIGATFWHMVDLLWILIFALLYVMR